MRRTNEKVMQTSITGIGSWEVFVEDEGLIQFWRIVVFERKKRHLWLEKQYGQSLLCEIGADRMVQIVEDNRGQGRKLDPTMKTFNLAWKNS